MKLVINFTTLFSLVSFLTVFYFSRVEGLEYIFILPLLIFILLISLRRSLCTYKSSIVFTLFLIQVVVRYLIIPILLPFNESAYASNIKAYGIETIYLMSLEAMFVFIFVSINAQKQKKSFISRIKTHEFIITSKNLFLVLILIFIYIVLSGYLSRINYIWELQAYINSKNEIEDSSNFSALLFIPFRVIVNLLIIGKIHKSNLNKNKKVIWLILLLILNGIIIVGVSRFNLLLTVLPLFYIIYLTFDKLKTTILYSFIALIIPVILITTINKFQNTGVINNSEIINSNTLNAYFGGPGNVSTGLRVYESKNNWSSSTYLFNDLAQNIPFISNYTDGFEKTNIDFNRQIYGHRLYQDQIVPLSLNGLIHFGVLGIVIYPILFISLAFYFERLYYQNDFIGYKFVFITIAITLSLIFMLNIGSIVSAIFRNFMFLLFPLYLIKKSRFLIKKTININSQS